jgi:thiamine biosynthesis lipoprotein ApbE
MGCEVVVDGATGGELARVEALFAERDAAFSRFREGSELKCVNRSAGKTLAVTPLFASAVEAALCAAAATDGLVDPTLGEAIEAAGYTCDFEQLEDDPSPAGAGRPGARSSVRLAGRLLRIPEDVRLDLNGVVKALAVDDALQLLSGPGFVSAGGDVAATAEVDIGLPGGAAVRLVRGALATSGSASRWWLRGGVLQHHLIDPATGLPADSPWEQVTACGATCLDADVAAKAAFLLGERGPSWLDEREIPGRFVSRDGEVTANEAWEGAAVCCT